LHAHILGFCGVEEQIALKKQKVENFIIKLKAHEGDEIKSRRCCEPAEQHELIRLKNYYMFVEKRKREKEREREKLFIFSRKLQS
jgi:hypothetical protein